MFAQLVDIRETDRMVTSLPEQQSSRRAGNSHAEIEGECTPRLEGGQAPLPLLFKPAQRTAVLLQRLRQAGKGQGCMASTL